MHLRINERKLEPPVIQKNEAKQGAQQPHHLESEGEQHVPDSSKHSLYLMKLSTGCYPFSSLRIGREQHVTDTSDHSLAFLIKLFNSSYQLLDGSIHLSPLSPCTTNDLPVNIATSLHQSLPDFVPFSGLVHHLPGGADARKHRHGHTHKTENWPSFHRGGSSDPALRRHARHCGTKPATSVLVLPQNMFGV